MLSPANATTVSLSHGHRGGGVDHYSVLYPRVIDDLDDPWRGQGLSIVTTNDYLHMSSFMYLGTRDGTREQPNATCRVHQVFLVSFFILFRFSFGYTRAMTQHSKRPFPPIVVLPGIVS